MKTLLLYVVLAGFLIIPNAFADTLVATGGFGWQNWVVGDVNENGAPYWDNISTDGSQKNIGYYLTNSGFFNGSTSGPGAIPFWGGSYNSGVDTPGTGTADPNFYFQKTAPLGYARFRLEIAGNAAHNEFGWYQRTGAAPALGDLHPIFVGGDTPASNESFTPTADYAFYIRVNDSTFYTTEGFSVGNGVDGFQHFAVFDDGSSYWIGMEDFFTGSDFDYNDMIVKISPDIPEPSTMLLLGSGLIGLAGYGRKRLFKK